MMRRVIAAAGLLGLASCGGPTASLIVEDVTCRPPLTDGGTAVAYFSVTSSIADRITGVSSPSAAAVEIHESTASGGMASMQELEFVELPAGQSVTFAPGGMHIMIISPDKTGPNATIPVRIALQSGREAAFDCTF